MLWQCFIEERPRVFRRFGTGLYLGRHNGKLSKVAVKVGDKNAGKGILSRRRSILFINSGKLISLALQSDSDGAT
ncbi:hypothetical protein SAMN04487894_11856 [Niabella drilacis]|uniref:Uncharacterized protein n=1 Tax=Niabella drilacis (strain DSM 25811 / CCM 8410 / CCUG 62505 / LMG 26954 / E90) TaxID=1285928 RepID=A0A1G6ZIH3_NIADE|nr:hypothetical protein SAMN04487894_11856 [Niabella drilacis]